MSNKLEHVGAIIKRVVEQIPTGGTPKTLDQAISDCFNWMSDDHKQRTTTRVTAAVRDFLAQRFTAAMNGVSDDESARLMALFNKIVGKE